MSADWIEGRFEGVYSGPLRPAPASRRKRGRRLPRSEPRRFGFEIQSGRVSEPRPCEEPAPEASECERLIRQDRLKQVQLVDDAGQISDLDTALFDVRISDWQLGHPAEDGDRAYGTVVGRIRARRRPALEAPAAPTPAVGAHAQAAIADRLGTEPRRSPQHAQAESLGDPAGTIARMGWAVVLCLLAGVFAGLAYACGPRYAGIWLAPIAVALLQLRVTREAAAPRTPGWLAIALAAPQLLVMGWLLDVAWQTRCWTSAGTLQLVLLAAPVLLSAILGSRGGLWTTGAIWTLVLCSGCPAAGDASCATGPALAAAAPAEATQAAPVAERPRRTDEHGRWPVMPPLTVSDSGGPAGAGAPEVPGTTTAAADATRTPAADGIAGTGGADGARADVPSPTPNAGGASPPAAPPLPLRSPGVPPTPTTRPSESPPSPDAQTASDGQRRLSQVDGGWLSPDHRRAPRELVLISIEQANRTPALFFDSAGAHRVYVPTDPLFKNGSSQLRKDAPLVLARIAALLSLPSRGRIALDVHSDSAGAPENQLGLCQRRADRVRSWLLDRGHVPADRFEMRAVGGSRPLVPPDGDYAAQRPNRRIELRLVEGS